MLKCGKILVLRDSIVLSVFDPIVVVANFIIQGRIVIQNIWHVATSVWPDEIPNSIFTQSGSNGWRILNVFQQLEFRDATIKMWPW